MRTLIVRTFVLCAAISASGCSATDILAIKDAVRTTCAGARGACALVETACTASDGVTSGGETP